MSHWTVLQVAFLWLITPEPAAAQVDAAPMPRGKPRVIVCAEGFFQVEVPPYLHGSCDSTPACPSVIHFRPVPMPRAIVEVIGNIEFGFFENDSCTACVPLTIFRPAPAFRSALHTSITAIEPAFTWNYSTPLPPPMPRAIVEVIGQGIGPCQNACPAPGLRKRQAASEHFSVCVDGPGGWWLDEARVPHFKSSAATGATPPVVVKACVSNNWWEPCDRAAGISTNEVASMLKPAPAAPNQLSGTWYREIEGAVFSATFSGDEMKICMTQCDEGGTVCFTITADYAATKEGLIHGVVTGVDVEVKRGPHASAGGVCAMPPAAITAELQKFVDSPFSFRTKTTSAGVMVSNLRFAAAGLDMEQLAVVCGMFKPAPNGKVPDPKSTKSASSAVSRCETPECQPLRANPYQPVPATGVQPPVSLPVVPAGGMVPPGVPQSFAPTKPMNVPLGDFGVMAEVFGQMLDARVPPMPAPLPVPTMRIPTPPKIERPR